MKLDYKKLFLLGFGFFAVSITWSIYNSLMPPLLQKYISNEAVIGFIMTIDNYLALFIQPAVGIYSDNHNTRFGRRMPFLMIGMPLAAIFLFLIPNHMNLLTLIIFLVCMNLSMSLFRSPVISLMPDITPRPLRSKSNSVINIMGGIGALTAYFLGSVLSKKNDAYPFYLCSVIVFISFLVLFFSINEKRDSLYFEAPVKSEKKDNKAKLTKEEGINLLILLSAICFYFIAYQGIEAFFTLYGMNHLNVSKSDAVLSFAFMSLSFLLFAYPAGVIGTKFGKKKTMVTGIACLIPCFILLGLANNLVTIRLILVVCGLFWALININSYPFVVEMAPKSKTGTYTGYYYTASSIAAIVSPLFLGFIIHSVGYYIMFFYGAVFFTLSLLFMLKVKRC